MHCLCTIAVMSFNWLLCKWLMPNATPGIKHVYTTLVTLWKFFHYSPKCARVIRGDSESTRSFRAQDRETARDTRWLAHEYCVKAVKASHSSIVLALENIYENHMNQKLLD